MKKRSRVRPRRRRRARRMTPGETEVLMAVMRSNIAAVERENEALRRAARP